jgi:hypothetical protein
VIHQHCAGLQAHNDVVFDDQDGETLNHFVQKLVGHEKPRRCLRPADHAADMLRSDRWVGAICHKISSIAAIFSLILAASVQSWAFEEFGAVG